MEPDITEISDTYEPLVQELERKMRDWDIPQNPSVFYGSSSIRLWKNIKSDLGSDSILNLGFGGSIVPACQYYYERIVAGYDLKSFVLYAGDNDIGQNREVADIISDTISLLQKVRNLNPQIPISYISIKPSPSRAERYSDITIVNEEVQKFIVQFPNSYYIDIYSPMMQVIKESPNDLFVEDLLHMNEKGYAIWKETLLQFAGKAY